MIFGFHPLTDFFSPKRMLEETVAAEKFGFSEIFLCRSLPPLDRCRRHNFCLDFNRFSC